jgi:hypothetical protein
VSRRVEIVMSLWKYEISVILKNLFSGLNQLDKFEGSSEKIDLS